MVSLESEIRQYPDLKKLNNYLILLFDITLFASVPLIIIACLFLYYGKSGIY